MRKRLIINDFKNNKLITLAIICFMAISACLIGLAVLLFANLAGSIDRLMITAKTPDFVQMHGGEIDENELETFCRKYPDADMLQICRFLNLENPSISISGKSFVNNTQDNGICVQNEYFDHLVDMDGNAINASEGEVYVPVCYKKEYDIHIGDRMLIGNYSLTVAGFLRDSQMNSMMASSKRFLVNKLDYDRLTGVGIEEYIIEFKLKDGGDINAFATAYSDAGLPQNGPTITYTLIKTMNALSDGTMILVILLVSVVILMISLLCIRYIILTSLEKDKAEIGMLKAVGISKKDIRRLYFTKFIALSVFGAMLGAVGAFLLFKPLSDNMRELYGTSENTGLDYILSIAGIIFTEMIILLSIRKVLLKSEKISAVEALFRSGRFEKKKNRYLFIAFITMAALAITVIPNNMASTLASPDFVTNMGIGKSRIMIDIRQSEEMDDITQTVQGMLEEDDRLAGSVLMKTAMYKAELSDGSSYNLLIENGNHDIYPVDYVKGRFPCSENEIALSLLNSNELGINVGDELNIITVEGKRKCTVCGVYSDITNGGKTAKVDFDSMDSSIPSMWNVFYINLKDEDQVEEWTKEYQGYMKELGNGIKVTDIEGYTYSTYGQTIRSINNAAVMSLLSSGVVLLIVIILFMRLTVWQERKDISLKKALGLKSSDIRKAYIFKAAVYIVGGTVAGILVGCIPGEILVGGLLNTLGAAGFRFIISPIRVLLIIPIITVGVAFTASHIALTELKRIRAFECCMGRE